MQEVVLTNDTQRDARANRATACRLGIEFLAAPKLRQLLAVARSRGYKNVAATKPACVYGFGPKGGKAYRHETQ